MGEPDIRWRGESGRNYGYWIHPVDKKFRKIAGNIIFAKQDDQGEWIPLYVEETRNFDAGMGRKEKVQCALKNGATHAHVHFSSPSWQKRDAEKEDIIAKWDPVCNKL